MEVSCESEIPLLPLIASNYARNRRHHSDTVLPEQKSEGLSRNRPTSYPGVPFVMRWKNRDPWPIGFQDQFLLAVERQKRNNRKSRKPTTWQNLRKHQVKQQPGFVEPATKT